MPPTNSDLAALLAAVEQKANYVNGKCERHDEVNDLLDVLDDMLAALRAARDSGYAVALVSREAVEALREEQRLSERCAEGDGTNDDLYEARDCASHRACDLLARDLAGLLKETT